MSPIDGARYQITIMGFEERVTEATWRQSEHGFIEDNGGRWQLCELSMWRLLPDKNRPALVNLCATCRHCAVAGATLGCKLTSVLCPVTGGELVSSCWNLRRDPMGRCGPAGKLWQARDTAAAGDEMAKAQVPAGVTIQ